MTHAETVLRNCLKSLGIPESATNKHYTPKTAKREQAVMMLIPTLKGGGFQEVPGSKRVVLDNVSVYVAPGGTTLRLKPELMIHVAK